jgi:signal transduction histidine kinase
MLHQFLSTHRSELIGRCRSKVVLRESPRLIEGELEYGIPFFLDQLIKTLLVEQTSDPMQSRKVSGPAGGGLPAHSEMGETAALNGRELLRRGFTIEQVVHDYGDLCQAIMDLAFEASAPIGVDEFRTLNRCLDNVIAVAVTEFVYQRDFILADHQNQALNARLGFFAHELRNLLYTATLAVTVIKAGKVGHSGAIGGVLDRSLVGLRNLIDRSLSEVRITAGLPRHHALFSLAEFIAEIKLSASLEAEIKGSKLTISAVDPDLAVDADRDLLFSAVGNLLQNAFKFTHSGTEVILNAYALADRILIEVEDHCGGLPPRFEERMFLPFAQGSIDRSGLGLGLSIAKSSAEANHGTLTVRDMPDRGCVFTLNLPRHSLPTPV